MTQTAARLAGSVHHMCFVRIGGELALVTARDQGVEILDATDGRPVRVLLTGRSANAVLPMPRAGRGDMVLVGAGDGRVYGLDPATGDELVAASFGPSAVRDLEVFGADDDPTVAVILDSGLQIWQPSTDSRYRLPDPPELDPARLFKVCAYQWSGRTRVTCAYTDGLLATWDLADGAVPSVERAHDGPIWSLIDTVDDAGDPIVVSGGSDRRMRVWAPTAAGLAPREAFLADGTIRRLGHLHDGGTTMLVTASASGAVSLWRLDGPADRPEMVIARHSGEAWALVCASLPHGVLIASGDMNGSISISRLSTALLTPESVTDLFQTRTTIWALTHGTAPAGAYIACAGVDQTVNVIDPEGRRETLGLRHHTSTVRALAATGAHLVSGGADHRVLHWDPITGNLRAELPLEHVGEVWALSTYVDNGVPYVVSGGADGSVRLIALAGDETAPRVLADDCGEVSSIATIVTEDDVIVVVGSGRGLRALSVRHGTSRPLSLHPVSVVCALRETGRTLVVIARQDGQVELIDPFAGASIAPFAAVHEAGQVRALESVEVAGTTFILGGCDDGRVVVWQIDGGLVARPVRVGTAGIRAMDVIEVAPPAGSSRADAPTRSALVTAGHDGTVRLWPITVDSPLRSDSSVGRSVKPASILLQDQPTGHDQLSRDTLVDTLYDALTSAGTRPPVVVGVHAPWGHGKSSLLRQLRGRVDPWSERDPANRPPSHRLALLPPAKGRRRDDTVRTKLTRAWAWGQVQRSGDQQAPLSYEMRAIKPGRYDAVSVWFNPWMYEHTEQVWAGLTREILNAVTDRLDKSERERLWFDLNLRRADTNTMRKRILASYLPRTLTGAVVAALLLFVVAVAVVAMGVAAVNSPSVERLVGPSTLILLSALAAIAQLTSGSFKQIHGWVAPEQLGSSGRPEQAWRGASDPLTATDRGYLYMLQHDVGEVVQLATRHGPLYVFIDDLDRCGPAIVADTIEAINLFLNKAFGQCVFVVALDPATVAAHLETSFRDINDRAEEDATSFGHLRHTGWRFMEKIIDLPIRLPRVADTALKEYLDGLLRAAAPEPAAVPDAPTPARAPRQRGRGAAQPPPADDAGTGDGAEPTVSAVPGRTTVELVIMPDSVDSVANAVAAVEALEALEPVRVALQSAVLSLPARNPRQTKAFVNLWRFYMVLDHRMGLFSPSLHAIERHSIEMARLVEIMVRWPYLLDPLGELAGEGVVDSTTTNLDRLLETCGGDDQAWNAAARHARLDPEDRVVQGLRELLRRALPHREVFASIGRRYL